MATAAFWAFLGKTVLISLSGVMAPGPITAVTANKGVENPRAGAWVAVGHGLFEIPLMVGIMGGLGYFLTRDSVQVAILLLGGGMLLLMGSGMVRGAFRKPEAVPADAPTLHGKSPLWAGLLLSAGNPYFLLWWATIGAALITQAAAFGWWAFAVFACVHWACDFVWYWILSALSHRGGRAWGQRFQTWIGIGCGALLLVFGGLFLYEAAVFGTHEATRARSEREKVLEQPQTITGQKAFRVELDALDG